MNFKIPPKPLFPLMTLIIPIFLMLGPANSLASQCRPYSQIPSHLNPAKDFLNQAIYNMHSLFADENFNSKNSAKKRADLFDTVFNTAHWSQVIQNTKATLVVWNWVRMQYWGAMNQQGLLSEEQGFAISNDKALANSFKKVYNLPIYPYVNGVQKYNCRSGEHTYYPCRQNIYKFKVTLSPSLACSKSNLRDVLSFDYLLTRTSSGWSILDVKLKGLDLIKSAFSGFEDLRNKYETTKSIRHWQLLYSTPYIFAIQTNQSGSRAFQREYRKKVPRYPLPF